MNMTIVRRFLIPVFFCWTAVGAAAQQQAQKTFPSYRSRVLGVYDGRTGDPIEGAKVSDMASGSSSLTTITGTVSLVFLPEGGSVVKVQKLGYEPKMLPVTISLDDTTALTLVMRPLAPGQGTLLPTVKTTAEAPYISPALRDFQEREKTGSAGYFISDTTLRKSEGHQLADVMRSRMPSVNFARGNGRGVFLMKSPACSSSAGGPPQVFLDGVPLASDPPPPPPPGAKRRNPPPPNSIPFDLSQFQVSELAGVEWYPSTSQAPIDYSGTSGRCGVLLLWTRER